jgi:P protein
VKAFKLAKGDLWLLTTYLCIFTGFISAFLDNVTTILLLTPVTIRLCRVLDTPVVPMLLAEVMFSNLGGTATAIGDPPNIIIVNDRRILEYEDEVNFGSFMIHVAPGVILSMIVVYFLIRFRVRDQMIRQPHKGLLIEIEIWERTQRKVNPMMSEEDQHVYDMLEAHLEVLRSRLNEEVEEVISPVDFQELETKYVIRDWNLFVSSCCVLGTVILFFFLHSAVNIDLSLAWIALIGAMVHLIVGNIHDLEEILEKVEFSTLLFFAGLFVLMRALEELGLIDFIANIVEDLIDQVEGPQKQLAVAVTLIVWVSAIISSFIDNIPFTTTMVPVVVGLHENLNLPLGPLVWSLSMGACFGGNGTLIGASANVVCV